MNVEIGGVVCDLVSVDVAEIQCTTNAIGHSLKADVLVTIAGKGKALTDVQFYYIGRYRILGSVFKSSATFVTLLYNEDLIMCINSDNISTRVVVLIWKVAVVYTVQFPVFFLFGHSLAIHSCEM